MLKYGSNICFIAKRCSLPRFYTTQVYVPPEFNDLTVSKWGKMSKPIQEEIAEYLGWRMEGPWQDLNSNEVQAAYFISYGPWGPRAPPGSKEAQMQMSGSEIIVRGIASMVIFTALSVCIINYKRDKDVNTLLQELENNVAANRKHE